MDLKTMLLGGQVDLLDPQTRAAFKRSEKLGDDARNMSSGVMDSFINDPTQTDAYAQSGMDAALTNKIADMDSKVLGQIQNAQVGNYFGGKGNSLANRSLANTVMSNNQGMQADMYMQDANMQMGSKQNSINTRAGLATGMQNLGAQYHQQTLSAPGKQQVAGMLPSALGNIVGGLASGFTGGFGKFTEAVGGGLAAKLLK
jgi:hypothetical protein